MPKGTVDFERRKETSGEKDMELYLNMVKSIQNGHVIACGTRRRHQAAWQYRCNAQSCLRYTLGTPGIKLLYYV